MKEDLTGRYLKVIKNFAGQQIGTYLFIEKDSPDNTCLLVKSYGHLTRDRIKDKEVELMPEGWSPTQVDDCVFPKGSYVVLLSSSMKGNIWNDSIPEDYCFKLREDSNNKCILLELDINGSKTNGWQTSDKSFKSQLKLRLATKAEQEYYDKIGKPFDVNNIPKETKVEVFPGIFVGDVVVSLADVGKFRKKGYITLVKNNSIVNLIAYKAETNTVELNSRAHSWRKATPEEVTAFQNGVKNINDMKKEEVTSQFEVGKWYKVKNIDGYWKFKSKGENGYMNIFCSIYLKVYTADSVIQNDMWFNCEELKDLSEIQSYLPEGHVDKIKEEWTPQVGEWVTVIKHVISTKEYDGYTCLGQTFKTNSIGTGGTYGKWVTGYKIEGKSPGGIYICDLRKATQAEIDAVTKPKEEDLLAEAKRRYPVGCEIIGISDKNTSSNTNAGRKTIIKTSYFVTQDRMGEKEKVVYAWDSNVYVYSDGKWAEIVEQPKTETLIITPIKGNYYVSKSSGNICRWGNGDSDYYLANGNIEFREGRGSFYYEDNELRYATPEEQLWLQTCIHYDRFLSRNSCEVEHAIKMGKCGEIKTEEKWQEGGYIRATTGVNIGKVLKVLKISKNYSPRLGDLIICGDSTNLRFWKEECEWLGMEKPIESIIFGTGGDIDRFGSFGLIYNPLDGAKIKTPNECYKKGFDEDAYNQNPLNKYLTININKTKKQKIRL